MANVLVYYAHPGNHHSQINSEMFKSAQGVGGLTCVDLYASYPRFDIDPDKEQQRLVDHDVIVFQFPLFWYSTPSILKEWQDIVLEHGFAYGSGGDKLAGKRMLLAVSAAGPEDAYQADGYQRHPLREFLRPLEQTAKLCEMDFLTPYVLYGSLKASAKGEIPPHVAGYRVLLEALRDDQLSGPAAAALDVLTHQKLPVMQGV